ncbi:MAG: hypothetical protein K2W85_05010 [Phycisphaerales bacterium]|nr:hypothetical protein [Phycisphaerales bacterium]
MSAGTYEKLGVFYLGKRYDLDAKTRTEDLVLYDSKDLVTHGVCVGMTGSGKTGLCLGLLEEAAIDGIPAIIIDPKGDLPNLLLTFEHLQPGDFRPWINEDDAQKKGKTPDDFAAAQAALWTRGLNDWQQDAARIGRLKSAADFRVYTPGSSAGFPVSVLKSFAAPPPELIEDGELFRDRVSGTSTSILGLLGIDADPIQSREHILLSAIIGQAWQHGRDLDLATLIQGIQQPPFDTLGVMPLESVYPAKDRFGLAMALNNLVAAPGFAAWMEGEALDIGRILYTEQGKPRHAIFSIAHLSDAERMFFVSLLLNQVLSWVRTQSGTTSLRAIVYMDEIAGYFPPTANPPSKKPLLTLMKQARAFGVGVVLATQNPVDLDYKGLANAGTWFIGRLQTDRDKQRVLDGLEGAAAGAGGGGRFDRAEMDRMLSQLSTRVFLMNNVHDDGPVIMETRWCMSYLRGPLTRQQIKTLMDPVKAAGRAATGAASSAAPRVAPTLSPTPAPPERAPAPTTSSAPADSSRPVLAPEIPQFFVPARGIGAGKALEYRPALLGMAKVYYSDTKAGVDEDDPQALLCPITTGPVPVDWDRAEASELTEDDLERGGEPGARFGALPPEAGKARNYAAWQRDFADALFKVGKLELFRAPEFKLSSKQGESEKDFRIRLSMAIRETRDELKERLRVKYAPKIAAIQERRRKAQQRLEVEKAQARDSKISTALSFGGALLGAFMGRKALSTGTISKASTAIGKVGRASKESGDVGRAEETIEAIQQQEAELNAQFEADLASIDAGADPQTMPLEKIVIKPKKTNIKVRALVLVWMPYAVGDGDPEPAW